MATETYELVSSTTLSGSVSTFSITGLTDYASYNITIKPIGGSGDPVVKINNSSSTHYATWMKSANIPQAGYRQDSGKAFVGVDTYPSSTPNVIWDIECLTAGQGGIAALFLKAFRAGGPAEIHCISMPASLSSLTFAYNSGNHTYSSGTTIDVYKLVR